MGSPCASVHRVTQPDGGGGFRRSRVARRQARDIKGDYYRPGHIAQCDRLLLQKEVRDCPRHAPLILPDGQISELPVQPLQQKYSCFQLTRLKSISFASHPPEGRWPSSRTLGWDAVDAAALGARCGRRAGWRKTRERPNGAQTNDAEADGKTVWSWHPLLVLSRWRRVGPTGLRQSIFADDGDKTNSSPGRARHKP
jgi:hypothetical protein